MSDWIKKKERNDVREFFIVFFILPTLILISPAILGAIIGFWIGRPEWSGSGLILGAMVGVLLTSICIKIFAVMQHKE